MQLTSNFRSNASLVDWINSLFSNLSPKITDIHKGNTIYHPARSTLPPIQNAVEWHINNTSNSYVDIITLIQEINYRTPEDSIAILVRSRNKVTSLITELKQANIAINAIEMEALIDYPIIKDLLIITKVLLSPSNKVAWLSLLRTPWCGLQLDDLLILTKHSNTLVIEAIQLAINKNLTISKDGYKRLKPIYLCLKDSQLWQEDRLAVKVRKLWHKLDNKCFLKYKKDTRYLDTFFQLINKYDNSIADIENKLAKSYIDNFDINNGIDVMTIHKAKGLEFDHVLLLDLDAPIRANAKPLLIWDEHLDSNGLESMIFAPYNTGSNGVYNFVYEREKIKMTYENKRLLYVAVTRAKKKLHLFANTYNTELTNTKWKKAAPGSLLSLMQQPECNIDLNTTNQLEESTHQRLNETINSSVYKTPEDAHAVLSPEPITLQRYRNIIQYHPEVNNTKNILINWQNPTKRAVGEIVHAILAEMAHYPLPDRSYLTQDTCMHLLTNKSVPDNKIVSAANDIMMAVNNMLSNSICRWVLDYRHNNSLCEYSISANINHSLQHRTIDRTFIDKTGNRWIIDYKLSHYNTQPHYTLSTFLQEQANKYKEQLINYSTFFKAEGKLVRLALCFPLLGKLYIYNKI